MLAMPEAPTFFNPAKPLVIPTRSGHCCRQHGDFYGTYLFGRTGGQGGVYGLLRIPNSTRYKPIALHGFTSRMGQRPQSGLVIDAAGNIYGTQRLEGLPAPNPDGVVFQVDTKA